MLIYWLINLSIWWTSLYLVATRSTFIMATEYNDLVATKSTYLVAFRLNNLVAIMQTLKKHMIGHRM
jgi:hypothetical protein